MGTLNRLTNHATELMIRVKNGETLSKAEWDIIKIFNSQHSGKAVNAGKRKKSN